MFRVKGLGLVRCQGMEKKMETSSFRVERVGFRNRNGNWGHYRDDGVGGDSLQTTVGTHGGLCGL